MLYNRSVCHYLLSSKHWQLSGFLETRLSLATVANAVLPTSRHSPFFPPTKNVSASEEPIPAPVIRILFFPFFQLNMSRADSSPLTAARARLAMSLSTNRHTSHKLSCQPTAVCDTVKCLVNSVKVSHDNLSNHNTSHGIYGLRWFQNTIQVMRSV